jgi:hypothetical protein
MEWERFTNDELEQELAASRAARSRLEAHDMEILEVLDARQVASADGCRSMSEWVASRLDIGIESARTLTRTMRRTADRPDLRERLASGEVSFDRVEALSRIPDDVGILEHLDVAGIGRQAALRAQITSESEFRTAKDRYLVLQPSLDESWWRLFGGLDGASGAIVDKVLNEMADQLPLLPEGIRGGSSWRKATVPDRARRHRRSSPCPGQCLRRRQTCCRVERPGRGHSGSRSSCRQGCPGDDPL